MFGTHVGRIIATYFILLFANLLVWAAAQSTGFEGNFVPSAVWNTFIGFFGGAGSLLAILVVLLVFGGVFIGTRWLSSHGHHTAVAILMVVALLIGGAILWQWVPWGSIMSTLSIPFLWMLLFTLIEAAAVFATLSVRREFIRRRTVANTTTVTP